MAKDSQGFSHHLKVVGGAYGKRKGFIYEPISTQNKKRQDFLPVFFIILSLKIYRRISSRIRHPVPVTSPTQYNRTRVDGLNQPVVL